VLISDEAAIRILKSRLKKLAVGELFSAKRSLPSGTNVRLSSR